MLKNSPPKNLPRYGCLIALLLAMMLAGSCATDSYKYLRQGHKYAAAGEWDNSVRFFQKAYDEDPENTEIDLMLKRSKYESSRMHMINGESYLAQELFNEAINEFRISMAMNPANTRAAELEGKAQRLLDALAHDPCGVDALAARTGLTAAEVSSMMLILELQGAVEFLPGGRYARKTTRS